MKYQIFLISIIIFFVLGGKVMAQFELSGEFRPRTEYLHGWWTLPQKDQDPAIFTEQRSRLNFKYSSEKFRIGMVFQDVRTWGSLSQANKSDTFSSFHETWAELLFNAKFSIKIGRQELIYDDHRIFGNLDWAQQGRSHDLALFQYKNNSNSIDLGFAYNQDKPQLNTNVYTVQKSYKAFQYLWANRTFSDNFKGSLLFLNNGLQYVKQPQDTSADVEYSIKYSQTAGIHTEYKKDKLKVVGSFYYQTGKDVDDTDVNALDYKAEIMYNITELFGAGVGFEYLSGTSQVDTANEENNSFNPFYGTNHKFNGYMDYFYVANHINSVGLQNIYLKFLYKWKKLSTALDLHFFSSAADILDSEELAKSGEYKAMNPKLGSELDFTFKYNYSDAIAFELGYAQMFATESMVALKGGNKDEISNWAYLMITFKPVFIKSQSLKTAD